MKINKIQYKKKKKIEVIEQMIFKLINYKM